MLHRCGCVSHDEYGGGAVLESTAMVRGTQQLRRGFSLIELVIVIVIIGIIAAIAIPRMSRGAQGAAESSLKANLAVLRNAIDLFHTEHEGKYPNAAAFAAEMTGYTDLEVPAVETSRTGDFIYGPYLREVPIMPVPGAGSKLNGVAAGPGTGVGWIYNATTGKIYANTAEQALNGDDFSDW
ncbi:MAG: type II secretion system protein [Phycisphaerae bacterium]